MYLFLKKRYIDCNMIQRRNSYMAEKKKKASNSSMRLLDKFH